MIDVLTDADDEAMAAVGVKGLRVDARPNAATLGCLRRACAAVATLTAENELCAQLLGRAPPATRHMLHGHTSEAATRMVVTV